MNSARNANHAARTFDRFVSSIVKITRLPDWQTWQTNHEVRKGLWAFFLDCIFRMIVSYFVSVFFPCQTITNPEKCYRYTSSSVMFVTSMPMETCSFPRSTALLNPTASSHGITPLTQTTGLRIVTTTSWRTIILACACLGLRVYRAQTTSTPTTSMATRRGALTLQVRDHCRRHVTTSGA